MVDNNYLKPIFTNTWVAISRGTEQAFGDKWRDFMDSTNQSLGVTYRFTNGTYIAEGSWSSIIELHKMIQLHEGHSDCRMSTSGKSTPTSGSYNNSWIDRSSFIQSTWSPINRADEQENHTIQSPEIHLPEIQPVQSGRDRNQVLLEMMEKRDSSSTAFKGYTQNGARKEIESFESNKDLVAKEKFSGSKNHGFSEMANRNTSTPDEDNIDDWSIYEKSISDDAKIENQFDESCEKSPLSISLGNEENTRQPDINSQSQITRHLQDQLSLVSSGSPLGSIDDLKTTDKGSFLDDEKSEKSQFDRQISSDSLPQLEQVRDRDEDIESEKEYMEDKAKTTIFEEKFGHESDKIKSGVNSDNDRQMSSGSMPPLEVLPDSPFETTGPGEKVVNSNVHESSNRALSPDMSNESIKFCIYEDSETPSARYSDDRARERMPDEPKQYDETAEMYMDMVAWLYMKDFYKKKLKQIEDTFHVNINCLKEEGEIVFLNITSKQTGGDVNGASLAVNDLQSIIMEKGTYNFIIKLPIGVTKEMCNTAAASLKTQHSDLDAVFTFNPCNNREFFIIADEENAAYLADKFKLNIGHTQQPFYEDTFSYKMQGLFKNPNSFNSDDFKSLDEAGQTHDHNNILPAGTNSSYTFEDEIDNYTVTDPASGDDISDIINKTDSLSLNDPVQKCAVTLPPKECSTEAASKVEKKPTSDFLNKYYLVEAETMRLAKKESPSIQLLYDLLDSNTDGVEEYINEILQGTGSESSSMASTMLDVDQSTRTSLEMLKTLENNSKTNVDSDDSKQTDFEIPKYQNQDIKYVEPDNSSEIQKNDVLPLTKQPDVKMTLKTDKRKDIAGYKGTGLQEIKFEFTDYEDLVFYLPRNEIGREIYSLLAEIFNKKALITIDANGIPVCRVPLKTTMDDHQGDRYLNSLLSVLQTLKQEQS